MSRPSGAVDRRALLILGVAMAAAAALLLWLGRGTTFIYDEWDFWAGYRPPTSLDALLTPDNGNLVLLPVAIYKVTIGLFGAAYLPYRAIEVCLVLADSLLFFLLAGAGERSRGWLALGPAILLLVFGSSYDVVGTPLGIPCLIGIGTGLAATIAVQRGTLRGDVAVFVLLLAGLASFTTAIPFAVGVGIVILVDGGPRRWTRLLTPGIPLIAYAAYRFQYRDYPTLDEAKVSLSHIGDAPSSLLDSWRGALNSLASPEQLQLSRGVALALLVLATVAIAYRLRMPEPVNRRALAYAAGLFVLWLSLAVLGKDPLAYRYQYPATVLLFLLAIELVAGLRIRRAAVAIAAVGIGLAIAYNTSELIRNTDRVVRASARQDRAKLAALEIIRDRVRLDRGLQRLANPEDPFFADIYLISAGEYLAAAGRDGSPAIGQAELRDADELQREAADRLLFNGLELVSRPRPARLAGCRAARHEGESWSIESSPLGGGYGVRAGRGSVAAQMRRYADVSTTYPIHFPAGSSRWLPIPSDRSRVPWRVALTAKRPFALCLRSGGIRSA
jgi:hypothetical protein